MKIDIAKLLLSTVIPLAGTTMPLKADSGDGPLVVTATNATAANQLLVYDTTGKLVQTLATQGKGGVAGNSGGIDTRNGSLAVVNFGSNNVSVFERTGRGFAMRELVPSVSPPVSVVLTADHLYILGTTKVESHAIYGSRVNTNPDGIVALLLADGSAAQVGVVKNQLIVTEKNGDIESVSLLSGGAVSGFAKLVQNIPANPMAPFGLVARGDDAYVTIAHSNEISLVRNGTVLTTASSGTQNAPCWLAIEGPFLFSSNSPSQSVSRFAVYGQKIVQDAAVAASFNGNPTDIAAQGGIVAVVDGNSTLAVSHLSIFKVDEDGNLTLVNAATMVAGANGVAVVQGEN